MTYALSKRTGNEQIIEYMESLSKNYFSRIFPDSTILIQAKPKAGKQGGHVVVVQHNEASSTNTTDKRFYVKPQDNFVLPWISSSPSGLADIEELFVYKFLYNFNAGPLVYFYANQEKPEHLLIATADANKMTDEEFYTAANYPRSDLKSITIENILIIRLIEIVFCLKDLLSNQNNFGWLNPSKRLLIIDFSIDKNEINTANATSLIKKAQMKLSMLGPLSLDRLIQNYNSERNNVKDLVLRRVIEPLIDSFSEAVDVTTQSMDDFVVSFPFVFNDRTKETTRSRLQQYAQQSRARFNELLTCLNVKKS